MPAGRRLAAVPPAPPSAQPDLSRWLTAEDVAAYLGVSIRTVRSWTAAGIIPHVRLPGRLVRFDRNAVDAWVASHAVAPVRGAQVGVAGVGDPASLGAHPRSARRGPGRRNP